MAKGLAGCHDIVDEGRAAAYTGMDEGEIGGPPGSPSDVPPIQAGSLLRTARPKPPNRPLGTLVSFVNLRQRYSLSHRSAVPPRWTILAAKVVRKAIRAVKFQPVEEGMGR